VDPERRVELEWDVTEDHVQPARIQVLSSDRSGILADMAGVMKKLGINILEASVHINEDQQGIADFVVEVKDVAQLRRILADIKRIKGVSNVRRLGLEGRGQVI
jgi:GTP pyrophosphokinase